jgi:hypothetical protein
VLKRLSHEFNCSISTEQTKCCFNLKVLSSEMNVAESTVDREEVFHKGTQFQRRRENSPRCTD